VSVSLGLMALLFVFAGVMHFVKPAPYIGIMPPWLPHPALLVLLSGIAEVAGGLGVLLPATRVIAGWGLIALLVAVFPANVQMFLDARAKGAGVLWMAAVTARLPLQALLIWWVWRSAVHG